MAVGQNEGAQIKLYLSWIIEDTSMRVYYLKGLYFIIAIVFTWEKERHCTHVLWMWDMLRLVRSTMMIRLLPPCWLNIGSMISQLCEHRESESNAPRPAATRGRSYFKLR
ncbi:hypothetical protein XPA_003239 [Xanthoria parietina]